MKRTFTITGRRVCEHAIAAIRTAPLGYRVTLEEPSRSREQNDALHPRVREIAKTVQFGGEWLNEYEWRTLLVSGWMKATGKDPRVVQGLEGEPVALRISSRRLSKVEFSELLEWVDAWAASHGIENRDAA